MDIESRFLPNISLSMKPTWGNMAGAKKWAVLLLFLLPLMLIAFKYSDLPNADYLREVISLLGMPAEMQDRVGYVLFVPLAAVIVVFFRVTLGVRLLGPFRSILLALAFHISGIGLGLLFLVVVGLIVCLRPVLKAIRLPYFGRVSVVLSAVAVLIMLALVASQWFKLGNLHQVAYFPIVVLCLTGDGFARTLSKERLRSALWRGAMTALVAVFITALWVIPGFVAVLIRFPELLVLEVGLIITISEFLGYRLFQNINPVPLKQQNKTKKNKKKPAHSRRIP